MARRSLSAGFLLAVMICHAGVAMAQESTAAPKPSAPAPKGSPKEYITVLLQNDCKVPILVAAMVYNLQGKWEPQGFWRLAPGEVAEAGKTTNRAYYVYGHELGDPECKKGCWSGSVPKSLQGEEWPFVEKTMNPLVTLGDVVKHKFSC
ncbi:hypothetical protein MNEG_1162 [Monoraphidium neglectum]|uniref:Uncharacterized protein n=1 Tax=Monoraphidium neglectum TaxID=145388 RepID=A0A0D2K999_9CHLO|nr:hypothetical protein MNEG_1162 [Monoraphidium neglectum]KIZ06788.1 hypothetical protein MNEG_1162 [Monoraphidium neglectum]|eukprot:XP_013905807.1 hypothetical protein MNEG_1162 [Monoraphidium neglectum]